MQYEPIKRSVGRFFSGSLFARKFLYFLLDLLLLRTWHVKKALRNIRNELPAEAIILDAGSGMGQYSWRLARMGDKWKVTGVDLNCSETNDCTDFFGKAGLSGRVAFICEDLTRFRGPDSFDLILSVDVMEHIEEDETVFSNFSSSLRPGGILIISTPSDQGGSDVHDDADESFIGEHVRNGYSREDITGKLVRAGFSSVDASYTYGKPGSLSWKLTMKYPVMMLNISRLFFLLLPLWYLLFFPFSMILNFADTRLTHSRGTGLLVVARKN